MLSHVMHVADEQVVARGGGGAAEFENVTVPPESLATLVYTSGTTGQPKVCMFPIAQTFSFIPNFREASDALTHRLPPTAWCSDRM